jgi:colicin import membrane protein
MNPRAGARFLPRSDPKFRAGALALGVHVAFALLLIFGVSWQTQQPAPVMVDVWDALPAIQPPRAAPPPPEPAPQPEPEPANVPAPAPRPVDEAPPPPKAPDLALEKKKAEAERQKELQAKQAAEEKARAEAARAEEARAAREKQAAEQKKRDLLRQMAEEDQTRAQEEANLARQAQAVASKRQAAVAGIVAQHIAMISAKVRSNTRLPDDLTGNPEVRCLVKLLPTGEVKSVQITKSSGNLAYDEAVVRAIEKSSPLPLPDDREARNSFVPELSFVHRPK